MSQPWALLPGSYVDGVRVVETTLRPVRPACLIPSDSPDMAARFAASRGLAWGGHASYAIPYSRSGGLGEQWEELLGLLDPDRVHAVGPLGEAEKERLREDGWFVYPRGGPEALSSEYSTLLHSALRAVADDLRPPDAKSFVVVPENPGGILGSLLMVARYGALDEEKLERVLEGRAPSYQYNLDLSKLVRVERIHPQARSPHLFAGDLRGWVEEDDVEHALTLHDLTIRGLSITGDVRSLRDRGDREIEDEYDAPMVVTGDAYQSVEDFALYWNLRAEHFFARPFPLWLPLDTLDSDYGSEDVQRALDISNEDYVVPRVRPRDVRIVSASTGTQELEDRLRGRYPEARIGVTRLSDVFKTMCRYRHVVERTTAQFERGRATIRPSRPDAFKRLVPWVDNVAYDVRVDGVWLPQSRALAKHLRRSAYNAHEMFSREGTLRIVGPFNKEYSEADLQEIHTPDGWDLLSSVFDELGYDITSTAKAAASLGQIELLGGTENLGVVASSRLRKLLREASSSRGLKREFVSERKTLPFGRFEEELGKEPAKAILRWLVERRVLFRGAVLECPRCRTAAWYAVGRIGETWRCEGCQEESPVPLDMDGTAWRYRINELYARGHDQGTLTPLLTLRVMIEAWHEKLGAGGLCYYPGVELKAKEGASVPFPHKEIDLVTMVDGSLVLAECKESTGYLHDSEKASRFARELADSVVLADHLGASRLVMASSTTFPDDKAPLLRKVPEGHSVELLWLDERDLLDPHFLNPLSFQGAGGSKPEGWEADYLKLLQARLFAPGA